MFNNPYFGIVLSFVTYWIGVRLNKRFKNPFLNPLLISIALCIAFLKAFHVSYKSYMLGGRFILFLIAPATVALVVPLYRNIDLLKENFKAIFGGVLVGSLSVMVTIALLSKAFHLNLELVTSLLPKSITTAIGIPLAEEYGGFSAVTAICIILTGILGGIIGPVFLKLIRVKDKVAFGVAMGTTSHAIGTARSMEIGEVEGAMSGLCIGMAGIITVVLLPFILKLI